MAQAIKLPTQSGARNALATSDAPEQGVAALKSLGEGSNDIDKVPRADASRFTGALHSSWHDPAIVGLVDSAPHVLLARDLPALAPPADDPVARPLASVDFGILPAQIVARVTSSPRQPVVGQTNDT